jgi:hypothetical protein
MEDAEPRLTVKQIHARESSWTFSLANGGVVFFGSEWHTAV